MGKSSRRRIIKEVERIRMINKKTKKSLIRNKLRVSIFQ